MRSYSIALTISTILGVGVALLNPEAITFGNIFRIIIATFIAVCAYIFLSKFFHKKIIQGAPFKPTDAEKINLMLNLAKLKQTDVVADLGSGSGTLISKVSEHVEQVDGYEINPILHVVAKLKNRTSKNTNFYLKNFWNANLEKYDVIFLYGIEYIMERLEIKLSNVEGKEIKVVSNHYMFPNKKHVANIEDIYLYVFRNS